MQYLNYLPRGISRLQGEGRGKALLAISMGSFLMIGVKMIYPVVLPELRSFYGFDLTTAGLLLSLLWTATAVGQLPGGMLSDRIGEGKTLVTSVVISSLMLTLVILSPSIVVLFVTTALFGLGLSLYGVARYTTMHDLFPDRVGFAIGIVLAAADVGQSLLPPIAGFIVVVVSWQLGFGFTLPVFVLAAVGLWLFVPARTSEATSRIDTLSLGSFVEILSRMYTRSVTYGTAVFVVYVSIWISFTSFYPTYLIEVKHLSSTQAAVLFGAFFGTGVVVKPLSGAAYDKFGIRFTMIAIAFVSGVALVLLPAVHGQLPLLVVTVLVAPILGSGTIVQSHLVDYLSSDIRGTGLGIIRTVGMGFASLTPAVFGLVADRGYFDEGFLGLAVLAGVLLVLVTRIPTD